jgi:aminopeptidase
MKKLIFILFFSGLTFLPFAQEKSSNQTPVEKFADVLINYSLQLKPNENILIITTPEARELNLELYKQVILAGAYPTLFYDDDDFLEIYFQYASDVQLNHADDLWVYEFNHADALLTILAGSNINSLKNVSSEKLQLYTLSNKELSEIWNRRVENQELKWCLALFPTSAYAQEAEMGTLAYRDFVFNAEKLYDNDPISSWSNSTVDQNRWVNWLSGKRQIKLKGTNIDMTISVDGRKFIVCDGKMNFPDGEIFCSPVENSANGWVKFSYPVTFNGKEIIDLELWFENGKVVKHNASKGDEFIASILETDEGAKVMGELGIGTNYEIKRFTKRILLDEKIGGTIHIAIGNGFREAGGINNSIIHLDMLYDMKESQIIVDGELFYKNGKFLK